MAEYIAREWSNGDIVTASNLNSMEAGIVDAQNDESSGGETLIIRLNEEATTSTKRVFDKTWQEVYDALRNGTRVIRIDETKIPPTVIVAPTLVATNDTSNQVAPYQVLVIEATSAAVNIGTMYADTADDYLYLEWGWQ